MFSIVSPAIMGVNWGKANKRMNTDRGIPRGSAALHTPAGYARR